MSKFIHYMGEFKFMTGLYFSAFVILSMIGSYFHGIREFSFVTIWQLLGISLVMAGIHYIQTSKLSPILRISIHSVLAYLTVVVFSLLCKWGFAESVSVFWQFTLTFIVIYILIFLAFAFYYKNNEAYLNKKLEEYKQKNK